MAIHQIVICLLIVFLCGSISGLQVQPGEDATLHCRVPGGKNTKFMEWVKSGLLPEHTNLLHRHQGLLQYDLQHPSFKGRVVLRDPKMKSGDDSVILKNVTVNDTGVYECRGAAADGSPPQIINTIVLKVEHSGLQVKPSVPPKIFTDMKLKVEDTGPKLGKNGHYGTILSVVFLGVLLVLVVIFCKKNPDEPVDVQHELESVSSPAASQLDAIDP